VRCRILWHLPSSSASLFFFCVPPVSKPCGPRPPSPAAAWNNPESGNTISSTFIRRLPPELGARARERRRPQPSNFAMPATGAMAPPNSNGSGGVSRSDNNAGGVSSSAIAAYKKERAELRKRYRKDQEERDIKYIDRLQKNDDDYNEVVAPTVAAHRRAMEALDKRRQKEIERINREYNSQVTSLTAKNAKMLKAPLTAWAREKHQAMDCVRKSRLKVSQRYDHELSNLRKRHRVAASKEVLKEDAKYATHLQEVCASHSTGRRRPVPRFHTV
jgi:hypothetical protein